MGTNSEAFLLTREERAQLIATAREAVGPDYPLMAGVGAHSTKQVLELAHDAAAAGANYLLVLPPAYFSKATNMSVAKRFFADVAYALYLCLFITSRGLQWGGYRIGDYHGDRPGICRRQSLWGLERCRRQIGLWFCR